MLLVLKKSSYDQCDHSRTLQVLSLSSLRSDQYSGRTRCFLSRPSNNLATCSSSRLLFGMDDAAAAAAAAADDDDDGDSDDGQLEFTFKLVVEI